MTQLDPQSLQRSARQWLTQREIALRGEIGAAMQAEATHHEHEVTDRKEEADERVQSGIASAEIERDLGELREVQAALKRLDEGRWGLCQDCDEPIDPRRLAVQPAATRCARCQAAREH
jgi:DnaK suppressor protein